MGLVKFDFLGLRTLTIIDWAVKAINKRRAQEGVEPLVIEALPLDDPKVYDLLKKAQTVAVFQLESRGMQGMLKEAQADRFEDIIALVALYRPGPMDLIPSFCARKHGKEAVEYPDPRVEPILKETYGIMVYQEQVMQMAQIVGGYTLGGADLLRRAMGKKKPEEMIKHRATFREGAAKDGIDGEKADAIFDLMEKFAGYGFNKSHAAAYALVSYQTAWLKAHYPAEFMAATISSDMDNTEKVVTFLDETRAIGIKVLPPDVNASEWMFEAVEPKVVRYGLGAIKGVGQGICEEIVAERKARGPFRGLVDFCQRVGSNKLNKRTMEALVQSGALDALGVNRATLLMHIPEAMRAADQEAKNRASGQVDIFGNAFGAAEAPALSNCRVLCPNGRWNNCCRASTTHSATICRAIRPIPGRRSLRSCRAVRSVRFRNAISRPSRGAATMTTTQAVSGVAPKRRGPWPAWSWACASAETATPSCRSRTPQACWKPASSAKCSRKRRRCSRAATSSSWRAACGSTISPVVINCVRARRTRCPMRWNTSAGY